MLDDSGDLRAIVIELGRLHVISAGSRLQSLFDE
jgi:hypothetical protein